MIKSKQLWSNKIMSVLLAVSLLFSITAVSAFSAKAQDITEEGTYTVPITSLTSSAPLQPVKTAFATAFGEEVTVTVDDNGAMKAKIKTQHIVVDMAQMGMGKFDANVLTVEGATVLSTREDVFSNPSNGLSSPVQEAITALDEFEIPLELDDSNSQVLTITVDFMDYFLNSGDSYPTNVTLTLDMDNAVKNEETTEETTEDTTEGTENPEQPEETTDTTETTENEEIDINNLKDGLYELPVALWHATKDQESMAASSVNETARILVKEGNITVYIYTMPMTFGSITASLQEMKVEQSDGTWVNAVVETKSSDGNPTCFSFSLDKLQQFINVKVNPHVEMMGNSDLDARIKFDLTSIKFVSENTDSDILTAPETTNLSSQQTKSPNTGNDFNAVYVASALAAISASVVLIYLSINSKRKENAC